MTDQPSKSYRRIPLGRNGQFAIVDLEDYERVVEHSWYAIQHPKNKSGVFYVIGYINGFGFQMPLHRFILNAPKGAIIDHHDGNPLNNRRENLRFASPAQSAANRRKNSNNTSGFKGVFWYKRENKWTARIVCDSRVIHLGYFKDPVRAAEAYDRAARRLHGAFARLNFPRPGEQGA